MEKEYVELRLILSKDLHNRFMAKLRSERRTQKSTMLGLINDYVDNRLGNVMKEDITLIEKLVSQIKKQGGSMETK